MPMLDEDFGPPSAVENSQSPPQILERPKINPKIGVSADLSITSKTPEALLWLITRTSDRFPHSTDIGKYL